ncbi:MAG: hypothetical protein WDZ59_16015 [Pirellulales bacterium]
MMRTTLLAVAIAGAMLAGASHAVEPWGGHHAKPPVRMNPWHGGYYHTAWGQPVALVVPPYASMHTDWAWGMAATRVSPNWHQFQRPFPGQVGFGRGFLPTPRWPSDTQQFGVYYVRGPW